MTDELNILHDKSKAKHDWDREVAKLSLSFGELEKYEYLAGEDLGYKPQAVDQVKFSIFSINKVFNKGSDERNKKGLLKRLTVLGNKNEL